jgi:hypothetical protein
MTLYNVHLYREMRLVFERIETDTPEAAADIARDKPTCDAADIDDCDGEASAALVDVVGDEEYLQTKMIDFEVERLRKAAPELLAALQETTPLLDACARNAERLGQREFAAQALTIMSANRAAIAKATTPHINQPERSHDHE